MMPLIKIDKNEIYREYYFSKKNLVFVDLRNWSTIVQHIRT